MNKEQVRELCVRLAHAILLILDKRDACGLGICKDYEGNPTHAERCIKIQELLAAHDAEVEERVRRETLEEAAILMDAKNWQGAAQWIRALASQSAPESK